MRRRIQRRPCRRIEQRVETVGGKTLDHDGTGIHRGEESRRIAWPRRSPRKTSPRSGTPSKPIRENQDLRNRLVEQYLPLVKYNAERIWARLPDGVELDDLISAGVFGLMDAIDAFDLTRGVKFETYCVPRIRGAMLDELRTMDWVPRLVRSQGQQAGRGAQVARGRARPAARPTTSWPSTWAQPSKSSRR